MRVEGCTARNQDTAYRYWHECQPDTPCPVHACTTDRCFCFQGVMTK